MKEGRKEGRNERTNERKEGQTDIRKKLRTIVYVGFLGFILVIPLLTSQIP